jgi:hypothetical protein
MHTHTTFVTARDYSYEFDLTNRLYESDRLKYKIRNHITEQFPALFRQHMYSTETWAEMTRKINEQTSDNIARINRATEVKVAELVENKEELALIKNHVINDATLKYDDFQLSLSKRSEAAEAERSKRLGELESSLSSLRSSQIYTFLGGSVLGGILGFLIRK